MNARVSVDAELDRSAGAEPCFCEAEPVFIENLARGFPFARVAVLQKFIATGGSYDLDCGNAVMRSFAAAYGMSVIVSSG
jgi:hypothetical protein